MKNVCLIFLVSFIMIPMASAQGNQKVFSDYHTDTGPYFIGVGIKGNVYVNDNSAHDFAVWKKPTLGINAFAGFWFSRYFGGRFLFEGGKVHPYFQNMTNKVEEKYVLGRLDLLFDFTNSLCMCTHKRFYNIIPYAGLSGAFVYDAENRPDKNEKSSSFLFGVGLINSFRMSYNLSTYINLGFDFVDSNFDGSKSVKNLNGIASASIGLVYDF